MTETEARSLEQRLCDDQLPLVWERRFVVQGWFRLTLGASYALVVFDRLRREWCRIESPAEWATALDGHPAGVACTSEGYRLV